MTVAAELSRLCAERGVTGYRLAPRVGTNHGHVHRWLTGKREPTIASLARIAEALGLTPEEIARVVKAAGRGDDR